MGKRVWPAKTGQERVRIIGDGDSTRTEYKAQHTPKALEQELPLKLKGGWELVTGTSRHWTSLWGKEAGKLGLKATLITHVSRPAPWVLHPIFGRSRQLQMP